MLWIDGVTWPVQLERLAMCGRAQSVVAVELREGLSETHVVELFHRTRRQSVPTGFLAREVLLLQHHGVESARRAPESRCSSGRAGADDENVGFARLRVWGHAISVWSGERVRVTERDGYLPDARGSVPMNAGGFSSIEKSLSSVSNDV